MYVINKIYIGANFIMIIDAHIQCSGAKRDDVLAIEWHPSARPYYGALLEWRYSLHKPILRRAIASARLMRVMRTDYGLR